MTPTGEVTHDIYYQKYLKYKAKYLELKKQLGGYNFGIKCRNVNCDSRSGHSFGGKYCTRGQCCNCGCNQ